MIHFKPFYLFSFMFLASFLHTEQLALPGCPRKCGNLMIPFPFGLNSECYFDDSFHIICNTSFKPPKPFLRSAEVLRISLQGKMKIWNSSSGFGEREGVVVIHWAAGKAACHVAQNRGSRYACQSLHSQCEDSRDGGGHICRCLPGYQGNPYLPHGCQDIDECKDSNPCEEGVCINLEGSFKCYHTKDEMMHVSSSFYFPIGIFVVTPLLSSYVLWTKREKKLQKLREEQFEQNGGNLLLRKLSRRRNGKLSIYTVEDMKSITNNYNATKGAFYLGTLSDDGSTASIEVAVVKIEKVPQSQIKQFVDQLIFLSQTHNENVVRIIGCCLETHSPLIVYELHGDGDATLFDCTRVRRACFSCDMRVKAAAGVARGLAYLNSHKCSKTKFVHGNLCSDNIMMDSSFNSKVFYVAGSNLIPRDTEENHVYIDPQFINSGRLDKKSDVYSFGVVLVELLTGGRTVSPIRRESDRSMALDFVCLARAGRLREILDQEMVGEADGEVVREIAVLAQRCLNVEPSKRPNMKEVVAKLSKLMPRE